jgi:hypothetical protein
MNSETDVVYRRNVGFPLLLGVVLVPLVFTWLLLRQGYSAKTKVLGMIWLVVTTSVIVQSELGNISQSSSSVFQSHSPDGRETKAADIVVNTKPDVVKEAEKLLAQDELKAVVPALSFSTEQICKAAIGTLMGRDPAIIKVTKSVAGVVFLQYIRPNDKSTWAYRCMLHGSEVIWATEPNGRWRIDPMDDLVTYEIKNERLTVTEKFVNGSRSNEKSFLQTQLGR